MKFRILRDYNEYQPQVLVEIDGEKPYWKDIGQYCCYTIDQAKTVCVDYKQMQEKPIVEEFEL